MQLIQPNLSVVGYPDYCLAYAEQVFGVKNDPDPNAWQAWLNTKFKHTDPIPTDVSVPVWFSWAGTVGGVTKNWGHVAVSTPNGVYTNPLSGSGHKVFPSVQALVTAYGVKYVGWSEDLGNLKIIGDNMDAVTVLQSALNAARADNDNLNKSIAILESALNASRAQVAALEAQAGKPTQLEPGLYKV